MAGMSRGAARGQANMVTALVMFLVFAVFCTGAFSFWRAMAVQGVVQNAAHYALASMESAGCYTQQLDQGLSQFLVANGVDPAYVSASASTGSQPVQYGYPVSVTVVATVPMWVLGNTVLWRIDVRSEQSGTSGYLPGNGSPPPPCTSPTFQDAASPTGSYRPVFGG